MGIQNESCVRVFFVLFGSGQILTSGCCEHGRKNTALLKAKYFLRWKSMKFQKDWAGVLTCVIIGDGHPDGDSQPAVPVDHPEEKGSRRVHGWLLQPTGTPELWWKPVDRAESISLKFEDWISSKLYLNIQPVPRSRHTPSRLQKPVG